MAQLVGGVCLDGFQTGIQFHMSGQNVSVLCVFPIDVILRPVCFNQDGPQVLKPVLDVLSIRNVDHSSKVFVLNQVSNAWHIVDYIKCLNLETAKAAGCGFAILVCPPDRDASCFVLMSESMMVT